MKDPRKDKLRNYRRGTSNERRLRTFWRHYDPWASKTERAIRQSERTEVRFKENSEHLELYSETVVTIQRGSNGAASCSI